jgi:hypothetical protein
MVTSSVQVLIKSTIRSVLQSKLSSLKQSPVLIIGSKPANEAFLDTKVGSVLHKLHHHASMEFDLKVIQSSVSSAFPTKSDVTKCIELAQRTGAGTLMAVGSGAAMDLCKIVASKYQCDEVILVPATSGGIIASSASGSLFLDEHEEAIHASECGSPNTTLVIDDIIHHKYAQQSALLIALDAMHRNTDENADNTTKICQLSFSGELTEALLLAGPLLSFGDKGHERSPILTLATSLIPMVYSNSHILEFWASLLPGKMQNMSNEMLVEYRQALTEVQGECPKLAEMSVDNLPLSKLMEYIHDNQVEWNTPEVYDGVFEALLESSLNR